MSEEVLVMSKKELKKLEIIQKVDEKRIKKTEAAKILRCSVRTIGRLHNKFKTFGPNGLVSKKRGRTSNRKFPDALQNTVISLILEKYVDFGPTLIAEKLEERDNIKVSAETIRQWMINNNLWSTKKIKIPRIHQPRARREHYGSLVQIDGSPHDWFEGRSEKCTLIVFVDDATSKIQLMRFFKSETTFAYFEMVEEYIRRYGMPQAYYSDKHSIFRINTETINENSDGFTQFGRAMNNLGIELIHANTPQAKGRVERKNSSLQDRLIKEMRLDGINNMEMANGDYLDKFTDKYNAKFAVSPTNPEDAHVKVEITEELCRHFTIQAEKKISKNLTITHKNNLYNITGTMTPRRLVGKRAIICEDVSGKITVLYNNTPLTVELYGKIRKQSKPLSKKEVNNKSLTPLTKSKAHKPAENHAWKRSARLAKAVKQDKEFYNNTNKNLH